MSYKVKSYTTPALHLHYKTPSMVNNRRNNGGQLQLSHNTNLTHSYLLWQADYIYISHDERVLMDFSYIN